MAKKEKNKPEKSAEIADPSSRFPDEAIYLLRTVQQHHVQLSLMADQKAAILIGATFVVFTLAIGQSSLGNFSVPLLVLAISAFSSAAMAAMAAMPSSTGKVGNRPNPLFFGVFAQLDEDEFIDDILEKVSTQDGTYRAMLRDIYQMGSVLAAKKYRYLGWAYRIFVAGLVITFLAYGYELVFGRIA